MFEIRSVEAGTSSDSLVTAFLVTLLLGSSFILNQLADIETDRVNDKLFIIARGHISRKTAIVEAIILLSIAVVFAFFVNYLLGWMFIVTYIITGIFYNFKPFAWKNKPILGVIANFLGGVSVASTGWVAAGSTTCRFLLYSLPYAFGLVAVYFLTTLADIKGDDAARKLTFGVRYGFRTSIRWALIFEMLAMGFALWTGDYIILIPTCMAFPLFVMIVLTENLNLALLTVKLSVLFTTLAVCMVYPYYLLVIIVLYYFSKWYYKRRFNIQYPRFAA
ncbi:UbiA family prenyltransferase [candidate division KSB1 bacterium]|nr:UbiA family prenyltransferase [candidate division KSB1 bacterium]